MRFRQQEQPEVRPSQRRGAARLLAYWPQVLLLAAVLLATLPFSAGAQRPADADPLSASIAALPTWHSGSSFSFRLFFSDDAQLSYTEVRDRLFEVDGGEIRRARRFMPGSNRFWEIDVSPSGFDDITLRLLATASCDDDGAVCTPDGRRLEHELVATVPGPGARLVARMSGLPNSHDGSTAFDVDLLFNHAPNVTSLTLHDRLIETSGGRIVATSRQDTDSSRGWEITIRPDSSGPVAIWLPITTDCETEDAVCTPDGQPLADGVFRTVRGPDGNQPPARPPSTIRQIERQSTITNQLTLEAPPVQLFAIDSFINDFALPAAEGGSGVYSYSLSGLPDGLAFDPATRILSGTPRQLPSNSAADFTATYTVNDGSTSVSAGFTITVEPWLAMVWDWEEGGGPTGELLWNNDSNCVREGQSTRNYMYWLDRQPNADVSVTLVNIHQNTGAQYEPIAATPSSLTFTPSNWDTPQNFRFTVPQDDDAEDPDTGFDTRVRSDDHRFNFNFRDFDICGIDDDTANVELSAASLHITEGTSDSYTIRPSTKPLGRVRVSIAVTDESNASASVSPTTVDFTHSNWTTPQTVTVTLHADDNDTDGSAVISHNVDSGSDFEYLILQLPDLAIAEVDHIAAITEIVGPAEPLTLFVRSEDEELVWSRGVAISQVLPAARGGVGPISYSLAHSNAQARNRHGDLPPGVSFDGPTRTVSGTPTLTTWMFTFLTYRAEDSTGATAEVTLLYLVEPNIQFPSIPDLEFTAGREIGVVQLPAATGCDGCTYHVPFSTRPEGIRLVGTTLVGTPTRATNGPINVTYEAEDSLGWTHSTQFRVTVNPAPRISVGFVPSFSAGRAIDPPIQLAAATGGTGDITYSLAPGQNGQGLPPGVTFDPATRTLSGTPIEATERYWVYYQATDANGATARTFLWLGVTDLSPSAQRTLPVRITGDNVPNFVVGTPIDPSYQLPAATGGAGEITYKLYRNGYRLPAGVSFDPGSRTLSGTPTQVTERYWMFYRATDEFGRLHIQKVWLGVSAAESSGAREPEPETTPARAPDSAPTVSDRSQFRNHEAAVGQPFSLTLPAADADSGNGGPYAYRLWHRGQNRNFMDQAINGLRFDPQSRTLSGTPAQAGVWLLSYVVHDSDDNRSVADRFRARTDLQITVSAE